MKEKSKISQLAKLFHYMKPFRGALIMAALALLVSSITILTIPLGMEYVVNHLKAEGAKDLLTNGLLALLAIVTVLSVATFSRIYFMTWAGERVVADIRRDVYAHTLGLSSEYHEKSRVGDILSRLTSDISVIQLVIGSSTAISFRHIMNLVGGTIMLFVISPRLALAIVAIVPVVVLPIVILGRRVRALSRENQEKLSDLAAHIEENVTGIKTVQAFGREVSETEKFNYLNTQTLATARERIKKRALLTALVILLVFSGIGLVLWLGGTAVMTGRIQAGDLVAFMLYSIFVATAVGSLSEVIGDLQRAGAAAERLMQVLQVESTVKDSPNAVALPPSSKAEIEFDNVSFSYPSTPDMEALQNFDLKIHAGEKVAIVGPSGAGKSTVFELLLRFYDVKSGAVKVDNIDVRNVRLEDLRQNIGIVSQDPIIFSTSAFQNIQFGKLDASREEVASAAQAAAATEFINRLPNGFDTYLGEKGVRISGGQKQRIAIARAILKNPKVLLLDEATSALDSENERLIQVAIENLSKDRTTIIIAHRLSTIKSADRIVVLNKGRIEGIGTHAELIQNNPLYKQLAELQFRE